MSQLSLALLGPVQIKLDGRSLSFRTNKVQALLCYLAVEGAAQPGVAYQRDAIMALLWPDMPIESAQDNLRQTLYQLRKILPKTVDGDDSPYLLSDRLAIQLHPEAGYELDAARFERLSRPEASLPQLEEAVSLYRDSFLADFYLADNNDFEEWAAEWRNQLRDKALGALDRLVGAYSLEARFDKVERYARRQLEIDNLRESAYRSLMVALVENGRRHEALQLYERCQMLMMEELGIAPSADTTKLFEQIRAGREVVIQHAVSLEEVRGASMPRHNLPAQKTSFVGREKELAKVVGLLTGPDCRLVVLLGPGGIGKTRLSLQVADQLSREGASYFPDGVYQVPLAAVSRMKDVIPAIAEAVGFSFSGSREPKRQLWAYLTPKKMLLVLDNLEQLAEEAEFLSEMLTGMPGLTLLGTSRVRLNLYEEWPVELGGLEAPVGESEADISQYSAIQLFLQRARQSGLETVTTTDLETIRHICQLLTCLPLGIELAAGWVRTYSLAQIASEIEGNLRFLTTRLKNVPGRHRSLEVTFEHSWQLLSAELRSILASVSVFRGGFDSAAAKYVAEASVRQVTDLVTHSMLWVVDGRFDQNELLRQFGEEKLRAGEALPVYGRHAEYYAVFLTDGERLRWTAEETAFLESVGLELKNILAGWQWAVTCLRFPERAEAGLSVLGQSATMLAYFYEQRNRFHEGVNLFQQTVESITAVWKEAEREAAVSEVLADVKVAEALMRFHLGQYAQVEKLLMDALVVFRKGNSPMKVANVFVRIGLTYNRLGKFEEAKQYLKEGLALLDGTDSRLEAVEVLMGLGIVETSLERYSEGLEYFNECLRIYREVGYQGGLARTLSNMGTAESRAGNPDKAFPIYQEALIIAQSLNNSMVVGIIYCNLGSTACLLADFEGSLAYYQESLKIFQEMDERRWIAVNLNGLGDTYLEIGNYKTAEINLKKALKISMDLQSLPDSLDSLAGLGQVLVRKDDPQLAYRLLSFVAQHPVAKPLARSKAETSLKMLALSMAEDALETAEAARASDSLIDLVEEISRE